MTHDAAIAALRTNTRRLTTGAVSYPEWSQTVDRILEDRFPDALFRRFVPLGACRASSFPTRTSTEPGTPRRATDRNRARAGDPAGETA